MTSLCSHHRVLLLHTLQEMRSLTLRNERVTMSTLTGERQREATPRDERGSVVHLRDEHAHCTPTSSWTGCHECTCRLAVCMCVKSCALSCAEVSTSCCIPCQHSSDVIHAARTERVSETQGVHGNTCQCGSPPPPPLSPKPADVECKPDCHDLNMVKVNKSSARLQPPSLIRHETHSTNTQADSPECTNIVDHTVNANTCTDHIPQTSMSKTETNPTKTAITQDKPKPLLDLQNKSSEISKELPKQEPALKLCDDTHLTEIITTVLHSSDEREYDLKQLFERHLASEEHLPLTRSRRRQEVTLAMNTAHDHPTFRRQSSQIRREPAQLESSKRKRKACTKTSITTSSLQAQVRSTDIETKTKSYSNVQLPEIMCHGVKSGASESIGIKRSQRNIVQPQRFFSYVNQDKMSNTASVPEINTAEVTLSPNSEMTKPLFNAKEVISSKRKVYEEKNSELSSPERSLRSRTRHSNNPTTFDHSSDDHIKYISPIKLMLVSSVKGENGVKYTLRAAQASPHKGFDPCIEASWTGDVIKRQTDHEVSQECSDSTKDRTDLHLSTEVLTNTDDSSNLVKNSLLSIKRRPGRPKKIKPLLEKAPKRPIGRPPKPLMSSITSGEELKKLKTDEACSEENRNINLKITVSYGRRKARRLVCEDLGLLPMKQCEAVAQSPSMNTKSSSSSEDNSARCFNADKEQKTLELIFAMPIEDRRSLQSNVKCQKQKGKESTTEVRRPGRPAKVKISGISITFTTASPQKRKVYMKREVKELHELSLASQFERSEGREIESQGEQASSVPVRHSVRERRPSIYLLNCIASSQSGVFKHRSRKLPITNDNNEPPWQTEPEVISDCNVLTNSAGRENKLQDAARFSATSVESIFTSDDKLAWWQTSASAETLKDELDKRIWVMNETWVSNNTQVSGSDPISGVASSSSVVKSLFEQKCSAEMLCSWFMQTTETQSLAIVKKPSARNSGEVFQYSSVRSCNKASSCSTPQAERLRKHLKKFAKVVPKSPSKLWQEQAKFQMCRLSVKRQLFRIPRRSQFETYRLTLKRVKSRFRMRGKKSNKKPKENKVHRKSVGAPVTKKDLVHASAWSTHTLKECSVFLKKLNTANKLLMSEECNDCTVRLSLSMEQQEQENSTSIKPKIKRSTHSFMPNQCDRKWKFSSTSETPSSPRKQRSSRGMMAAKWSDFILGGHFHLTLYTYNNVII